MAMSNDIFPPFSTIKYLYDNNAYTDLDILTFVELECLTKEQYTEITGDPFPEETPDKPNNVKINTKANSATITSE